MADRLSWQVERVLVDQTINTPAGDTIVVNYIYYVTGDGNHGVVYVPVDRFNEKNVADAIRPDAKRLDAIAALAENVQ